VPALQAQVLDVRASRLRDPQPVQREQRDQRVPGWRPGPGGAELAAVQRDGVGLVAAPRSADSRARSCRRRRALTGGSSATPPLRSSRSGCRRCRPGWTRCPPRCAWCRRRQGRGGSGVPRGTRETRFQRRFSGVPARVPTVTAVPGAAAGPSPAR
jgi:hypothetical protein